MKNSSRQLLVPLKMWVKFSDTMGPADLDRSQIAVASQAGFSMLAYQDKPWLVGCKQYGPALSFPDIPRILMIPLTVLVAAIASGLVVFSPGLLRAFWGRVKSSLLL